uniref:G-protein coupled receptors family 2 profile 2 domain-containing protein n=1 Tax=Strigamia maritima TaxID=126957 RepID=T1IV09_STRMM
MAYKSIYLNPSEYEITTNRTLSLTKAKINSHFTSEQYFVSKNNLTVLCLPLHPNYQKCIKTTISTMHFQLNEDKSANISNINAIYPNNLYRRVADGIEICYNEEICKNEICNDQTSDISDEYSSTDACMEGISFQSAEICSCYCFHQDGETNICKGIDYDKAVYKSFYLAQNEYIMSNESLVLIGPLSKLSKTNFSSAEYFMLKNSTKTVVLCYPLHIDMYNCTKNTIDWEFFKFRNDKSIYVSFYAKKYTFDFYTASIKGVEICRYESHSTVLKITAIVSGCSAVCLFVTFVLAFFLLNRHSNFALICYIAMLCLSSTAIAIVNTRSKNNKYFCPLFPLVIQFCNLSAFFWMNIYVHSICKSFCKLKMAVHPVTLKNRLISSFCGWGIPLIVGGITLTVDVFDVPMKPDFIDNCGYTPDGTSYLYEHGPMAISLVLNVVFLSGLWSRRENLQKMLQLSIKMRANRCMFWHSS